MFRQVLGHGPDPGPDFQHAVLSCDSRGAYDLVQYVGVYEKILTEFLLECKLIFLYDFNGLFRVAQIFFHVEFTYFLSFKIMVSY